MSDINPQSLSVVEAAADRSIGGAKVYDKFQFERVGYFSVDPDSTKEKVFYFRLHLLRSLFSNYYFFVVDL